MRQNFNRNKRARDESKKKRREEKMQKRLAKRNDGTSAEMPSAPPEGEGFIPGPETPPEETTS